MIPYNKALFDQFAPAIKQRFGFLGNSLKIYALGGKVYDPVTFAEERESLLKGKFHPGVDVTQDLFEVFAVDMGGEISYLVLIFDPLELMAEPGIWEVIEIERKVLKSSNKAILYDSGRILGSEVAEAAKEAFRHQSQFYAPFTYVKVWDDWPTECREFVLKQFPLAKKEEPLVVFLPNPGYCIFLTTKRLCLLNGDRRNRLPLKGILEVGDCIPFEKLEPLGERMAWVVPFEVEMKSILPWRNPMHWRIEHPAFYALEIAIASLCDAGKLPLMAQRQRTLRTHNEANHRRNADGDR